MLSPASHPAVLLAGRNLRAGPFPLQLLCPCARSKQLRLTNGGAELPWAEASRRPHGQPRRVAAIRGSGPRRAARDEPAMA